ACSRSATWKRSHNTHVSFYDAGRARRRRGHGYRRGGDRTQISRSRQPRLGDHFRERQKNQQCSYRGAGRAWNIIRHAARRRGSAPPVRLAGSASKTRDRWRGCAERVESARAGGHCRARGGERSAARYDGRCRQAAGGIIAEWEESNMKMMAPIEIGICCTDLERLRRFYVDVLGCTPVNEIEVPAEKSRPAALAENGYRVARLQTPWGERLKLLQPATAPENAPATEWILSRRGLAYITFIVDDLNTIIARLKTA